MKKDIHPTLHPVVFIDLSDGTEFVTKSTITSEETKKIDGVDHYVIKVEISSASHPFYTGKQKLIDTAGRVEKFKAKMAKANAHKGDDDDTAGDDDDASDDTTTDEAEETVVEEAAEAKKETILDSPAEKEVEEEVVVEEPAKEEATEDEAPAEEVVEEETTEEAAE